MPHSPLSPTPRSPRQSPLPWLWRAAWAGRRRAARPPGRASAPCTLQAAWRRTRLEWTRSHKIPGLHVAMAVVCLRSKQTPCFQQPCNNFSVPRSPHLNSACLHTVQYHFTISASPVNTNCGSSRVPSGRRVWGWGWGVSQMQVQLHHRRTHAHPDRWPPPRTIPTSLGECGCGYAPPCSRQYRLLQMQEAAGGSRPHPVKTATQLECMPGNQSTQRHGKARRAPKQGYLPTSTGASVAVACMQPLAGGRTVVHEERPGLLSCRLWLWLAS